MRYSYLVVMFIQAAHAAGPALIGPSPRHPTTAEVEQESKRFGDAVLACGRIFPAPSDLYFTTEALKARKPALTGVEFTEFRFTGQGIWVRFTSVDDPASHWWVNPQQIVAARFSLSVTKNPPVFHRMGGPNPAAELLQSARHMETHPPPDLPQLHQLRSIMDRPSLYLTEDELRNRKPTLQVRGLVTATNGTSRTGN